MDVRDYLDIRIVSEKRVYANYAILAEESPFKSKNDKDACPDVMPNP